jgi:CRISPR type III-A-associated RAMP protein Csm4
MQPGLLIRLRPLGAWRFGPADGGHDQVDTLYRSDRLYSAVTLAMQRLGFLEEWIEATADAAKPAVVFSSLYPFQGETLYAIPPANLWPPPQPLLNTPSPVFLAKIRWKSARFVPLSVIDSLITGQPILADQWLPDAESGCLLRRDRPSSSPFRVVARSTAAVDRLNQTSDEVRPLACVEFEQSAGLWTVARFAGTAEEQAWSSRLQAALRLLSDSGFGGGRTRGWGQTQAAEFQAGAWPGILLPKLGRLLRNAPAVAGEEGSAAYWLLSLYSPAASDKVDWSGGHYSLSTRGGRVESLSGTGALKKTARMVGEGCVLSASSEPVGAAVNVAPDGFAHAVYRSGLALALRLPVVQVRTPEEKTPSRTATESALPSVSELEPEALAPAALDEETPRKEEEVAEPVEAEVANAPGAESDVEAPAEPAADEETPREEEEVVEPVEAEVADAPGSESDVETPAEPAAEEETPREEEEVAEPVEAEVADASVSESDGESPAEPVNQPSAEGETPHEV